MLRERTTPPDLRRVLVCPHNFEIGGSQINALELAASVAQDPRFEVAVYAPGGVLAERARAAGLELHLTTLHESAPWIPRIAEIRRLTRELDIDLIHAYEWNVSIDAAYAGWLMDRPIVSTVLSMEYPDYLPRDIPLILGTRELHRAAMAEGRDSHLIEPPVDTDVFAPGSIGPEAIAAARRECHAAPEQSLNVVVGRLAQQLKLDGLLALVDAMSIVSDSHDAVLAIVGDGPARPHVEAAAARVNQRAGREVIRLLGARSEPAPYYAAADLVVGMGSSALRAMAMGRPLLVQGERAFWRAATDASFATFAEQGWYGVGTGDNSAALCADELLMMLSTTPATRVEWGRRGRELVVDRYSLTAATRDLIAVYDHALRDRPSGAERLAASLQAAPPILAGRGRIAAYHLRDRLAGVRRP